MRQVGLYNSGDEYDYAFVWPEHVTGKEADEACCCLYY